VRVEGAGATATCSDREKDQTLTLMPVAGSMRGDRCEQAEFPDCDNEKRRRGTEESLGGPQLTGERIRGFGYGCLGVILLGLAGCSSTAPTLPKTTYPASANQTFQQALLQHAPEVPAAEMPRFEGLAQTICSDLSGGSSIQTEVKILYQDSLGADVATGILAGAVDAHCPSYQAQLQAWVSSP